jgi:hypothetical protein
VPNVGNLINAIPGQPTTKTNYHAHPHKSKNSDFPPARWIAAGLDWQGMGIAILDAFEKAGDFLCRCGAAFLLAGRRAHVFAITHIKLSF